MPKIVLAQSGANDGYSMRRYAAELGRALSEHANEDWSFERRLPSASIVTNGQIGSLGRLLNFAKRYIGYSLAARTWNADLVHVLDHAYAQVVLGVHNAKVLVTCHDTIPWLAKTGRLPRSLPPRVILTVVWRLKLMRKADWVIADSNSTKGDIEDLVPGLKGRVSVVYPGISAEIMLAEVDRAKARSDHGIDAGDRLVLSVGASKPYKNSVGLAEAFKIVSAKTASLKWIAVGGIAEDAKRILQQSGLFQRLQEIHGVTDGELARLYRISDVLVFPSLYEGFGWPPLEAMACSVPVVASCAGSLREVLGEAALLTDPTDVRGIAASTLRLLLDESFRKRQIVAGLAHVRRFSWERAARETLEVYTTLLGVHPSR